MTGPLIHISDADFQACVDYVERTQARAHQRGYDHRTNAIVGRSRSIEQVYRDWTNGHCAEIALCRWLGLDWTPDPDAFHTRPDLFGVFEVRSTVYRTGCLVVTTGDHAPGRCFVLVIGDAYRRPRAMRLVGYLWGQQLDQVDPAHVSHRPTQQGGWAMFIDQQALRPLTDQVRDQALNFVTGAHQ